MYLHGVYTASLIGLILGCKPRPDLDDSHRDLSEALTVFPGAEGFGSDTTAGRGGEVLIVSNLKAAGPGSLRAALEAKGKRTVVFSVSGTIWTTEDITIADPFLTVAGQTAPSPGITLAGAGIRVEASDVLIQHLRIRPGDREEGPKGENRDALTIANHHELIARVVIDHCSLSWGTDENTSTWYDLEDITYSHNLISEGLYESLHPEGEHSKGLLIGDGSRRVSVIRNVFAHNEDRNPVMKGDTSTLVVNNLVYDPGVFGIVHYGKRGCCPMLATIEENQVIPGKSTPDSAVALTITGKSNKKSRIYERANGSTQNDGKDEIWTSDPPVSVLPLTVVPRSELESLLLPVVGARPADRDEVDNRVISQIIDRTGKGIDSQKQVGGWPDLAENEATWELPSEPSADDNGDGYTNLEEWIHGILPR